MLIEQFMNSKVLPLDKLQPSTETLDKPEKSLSGTNTPAYFAFVIKEKCL
jgi:hypothetical protein